MNDNLYKVKQIIKAILTLIIANIVLSFIFAIIFTMTEKKSISYLLSYLISCIILFLINRQKLVKDFKTLKNDYHGKIINIITFTFIFIILMLISNYILYILSNNLASNEIEARKLFFSSPILMGLSIGFLAPIFEELVSRYPYRDIKVNPKLKMIFYSTLFAVLHISNINNIFDFLYIIPYLFLSLAFSYSFYKTNNIYGSILVHIINNSVTLLLLTIL